MYLGIDNVRKLVKSITKKFIVESESCAAQKLNDSRVEGTWSGRCAGNNSDINPSKSHFSAVKIKFYLFNTQKPTEKNQRSKGKSVCERAKYLQSTNWINECRRNEWLKYSALKRFVEQPTTEINALWFYPKVRFVFFLFCLLPLLFIRTCNIYLIFYIFS